MNKSAKSTGSLTAAARLRLPNRERKRPVLLILLHPYFFAATGVTGVAVFFATVFFADFLCAVLLCATFFTPAFLVAELVAAAGFAAVLV